LFSEDVSELGPKDEGRRNLYDFLEFNYQIEHWSPALISDKWPELITLSDSADVIKMYKRAAGESRKVFQSHPKIAAIVK
jgi:hypothetical protein